MLLKQLGGTGNQLPEIGMGTWEYCGGVEPLRKGLSLGVFLIDTAETYGTEEVVGEAVKGMRHRVFIATKVAPSHFRWQHLMAAADASLRRLKTDYIDLYQLHWPTVSVPIEETLGAMEELVDRGKVRFIGVSNFSVPELKKARRALSKHTIVSNQVRYSLVDRTIEPRLLPYCQENRISILAYSPLGRGLPQLKRMDPDNLLGRIAAELGKSPAQVALNWCVARNGVIAIPKSNTADRVAENCLASGWRLSAEQLQQLDAGIRFNRRSLAEQTLRRTARSLLQAFGYV